MLHRLSSLFVTQRRRAIAATILIISPGTKARGGVSEYFERLTGYIGIRDRVQADAGDRGSDGERRISSTVVPANDIGELVGKLRLLNGNALVVGHGNTIPDLLKALSVTTSVSISDDDYSEIFVVLTSDTPQLLRLHYPF